jgi:Fe-S-cluster-containing dehydrogenase component
MPVLPSTIWLSREERRALVREHRAPTTTPTPTAGRCLYCFDRLTNGSPVCSEACDSGWWALVPTLDGELYGVAPPEPEPPQRRAPTPAERQRKRRAKIKAERREKQASHRARGTLDSAPEA